MQLNILKCVILTIFISAISGCKVAESILTGGQDNGPNYRGLYQYKDRDSNFGPVFHYLKFYKKYRIMIFVYSTGRPTKVARWFKRENRGFRYYTYQISEDSVEFQLSFRDSVKTKFRGHILASKLEFKLENTWKGDIFETFDRTYYLKDTRVIRKGEKARAKGKVHKLKTTKSVDKKKRRRIERWKNKLSKHRKHRQREGLRYD